MPRLFMRLIKPLLPARRFTERDRRVASAMYVAGVLQGFALAHGANTLPFVRATLGISEGQMSQVLAVARLGAIAAIGVSMWSDRGGRRRPFLISFVLLLVAAAATAGAGSATQFTVAQFVVRAAGSSTAVLAGVILAEELSASIRAYGIAIYGAAASFGAGVATVALPVADSSPEAWRWLFASSAIGLFLVPALVGRISETAAFGESSVQPVAVLFTTFRNRFLPLAIISITSAAYAAVAVSFLFERLVDDLGFSTPQAVAISLIGGTVGGIGFPVGGRLADTWGRRPTALLAIATSVVGGIGLYHGNAAWLLGLAGALSAFGSFVAIPAIGAQRNEMFPTGIRATAAVSLNSIAVIGSILGLGLGGFTIDRFGLTATVTVLALVTAVAGTLELALPETRGQAISPTAK